MNKTLQAAAVLAVMLIACCANANIVIETVSVGNPGNAGEWSTDGPAPDRICGAVDYGYSFGKYSVTNSQYAEFLNAVAATDTYDLYNTRMANSLGGITQSGSSGSYSYVPTAGRENMPVNFVNWYDTLRFANWLQNGRPTGPQGFGTTEDGTYVLTGRTTVAEPLPDHSSFLTPHWVLPTEDEWYKTAYYDPAKSGGAGYWDYPTKHDDPVSPTPGVHANFGDAVGDLTPVDYFSYPSAYGSYDQGGNVYEWNEADISGDGVYRGLRGGGHDSLPGNQLHAMFRSQHAATDEVNANVGFRVALVPEPGTLSLLLLGGILVLRRRS